MSWGNVKKGVDAKYGAVNRRWTEICLIFSGLAGGSGLLLGWLPVSTHWKLIALLVFASPLILAIVFKLIEIRRKSQDASSS